MMNVMAMWVLLSSLGAAMVMSPEPLLVKTPDGEQRSFDLAKEATRESLHYASEAARQTGESIRKTVTQIPTKAAHTVQRKAGEAAQVIKDGSQAGLEKIGLARPAPPPSSFEVWESGLQASKDRATAIKDAAKDSVHHIEQEVHDTVVKPFQPAPPPTRYEILKEKVAHAHDATGLKFRATKNKGEEVAEGMKDSVVGAGERVQEGAHDTVTGAKNKAGNAVKHGEEAASESSGYVGDLASRIADSVEEHIDTAGGKASETYEKAADGLQETAAKAKQAVGLDPPPPSYQERIHQATEQAADILRNRGKEAASFLPNVGQGLAQGSPDTQEKPAVGDYVSKAGELLGVKKGGGSDAEPGFKSKVGHYVDGVKSKFSRGHDTAEKKTEDWREEFLSKLGIYSEEDLKKKDIIVGNFKGYFSGGVFYRAGQALSNAASATQDAVHFVGNKTTDTFEHAKDSVAGTVESAHDHLTPTWGDDTVEKHHEDESLKDKTANILKKVGWITTAWILSTFRTAHLFAFSAVYGTALWITFVSGYVLSRSVPRHQFGFVQSRVFPTYLKLVASGQLICLASYIILHPWPQADRAEKFQYLDLWGILMTTLGNTFFLEPRATKIMFEKLKLEKEEGRGAHDGLAAASSGAEEEETKARLSKINTSFHVLHGYSSLANLLGLLGMTWHLWHLSRRLVI